LKILEIPQVNLDEEELKMALAIKLFEEGKVSLGKAAEIAGFSVKSFAEILLKRGVSPLSFENIDIEKELGNA
jgi:predicted HTH domain antitoxin